MDKKYQIFSSSYTFQRELIIDGFIVKYNTVTTS